MDKSFAIGKLKLFGSELVQQNLLRLSLHLNLKSFQYVSSMLIK